jgi:hypothetical protein
MEKKYLTQFIDKYHLNGLVESVKWNSTENDGFSVKFVTQTKDCAGNIRTTQDLGFGQHDICIYSTSQFNKILSVMDTFMTVDVITGSQNIPYQLSIKDNDFDLTYYLSSEDLIPTAPNINEPEEYDVEFDIDEDFIKNFIKAHNALDKPNYFTVECKVENEEKFIELCVGDSASYANKIKLRQNAEFTFGVDKMPFSANVFREILSVNKLATGKGKINQQGLLKMVFTEDDTVSTYFLVKLSE